MCLHMHLDHYMYPIVILTTSFFLGGGIVFRGALIEAECKARMNFLL